MASYYQLLPLPQLGEHSISMRGEDLFGSAYFVDGTATDLGGSAQHRVLIDTDLDPRKFVRIQPDWLMTTKGIPLVTERFVHAAAPALVSEVDLAPASVSVGGQEYDFFAVRTRKALPLIDPQASVYSHIGDVAILTDPVFLQPEEPFLLARDSRFRDYLCASSRTADLIEEENLRVLVTPF